MADEDRTYEWLWWVAAVAAMGCVVLIVAYYTRHPERSWAADFSPRRSPAAVVSLHPNGSSPSAPDVAPPPGSPPGQDVPIE